jgi:hypothetical protein
MTVAGFGAFALGEHMEAIAVVALYQIGELLQGLAVTKSKKSIAEVMDIRPDHANVLTADGTVRTAAPISLLLGEHNLARRDGATLTAAARQLDIFTAARDGKLRGTNPDTSAEDAMIAALTDYLKGGTEA